MRHKTFLIILIGLFSCNQRFGDSEKRTISKDSIYVYGPLGWEIQIPNDYELLTTKDEKKMNERGLKAMRETVGEDFEVQPFYDLISFRKDKINVFLSNSQIIDSVEFPSYDEVHDEVIDVLIKTYEDRKIKVNHKSDTETINNKIFVKDEFELMTDDNKYFMSQIMYTDYLVILN